MASLAVIRGYEAVAGLLFLVGLIWVWRARRPLYYGVYLGSSVGGGIFEWVFDSRYYFRLTADERFISAWTIDGVEAPLAMILFYAFFFGIPLLWIADRHEALKQRFGNAKVYIGLLLLGVIGTPLFECTNVSIAHIYHYHQAEPYLLYGMPWSNLWFGALMFVCPYWGLIQVRSLLDSIQSAPQRFGWFSWQQEAALGFAVIITGFFVAATVNGVWYAWAEPWVASPRPF